jgi:hypothetical protein
MKIPQAVTGIATISDFLLQIFRGMYLSDWEKSAAFFQNWENIIFSEFMYFSAFYLLLLYK